MMRRLGAMTLTLALLGATSDQDDVLDRGAFTITQRGVIVGQETFAVRRGRGAGPGLVITTTATYPPEHPTVTLAAVVELGGDSAALQLQLDEIGARARRYLARFAGRRVTLRVLSPAGESAREYPQLRHSVAVDDSLFALYALLPRPPAIIGLFNPRTGRSVVAALSDAGMDTVTFGPTTRVLRHVVLSPAEDLTHIWYDDAGRVIAVERPRLGLRAER